MILSIKLHNPFKTLRMRLHHQQTTATVKMLAKPKRLARDRIQDKLTLQARLALAQAISASMAVLALFSPGILYHTHRLLLSIRKWPTMPFRIVIFLLI